MRVGTRQGLVRVRGLGRWRRRRARRIPDVGATGLAPSGSPALQRAPALHRRARSHGRARALPPRRCARPPACVGRLPRRPTCRKRSRLQGPLPMSAAAAACTPCSTSDIPGDHISCCPDRQNRGGGEGGARTRGEARRAVDDRGRECTDRFVARGRRQLDRRGETAAAARVADVFAGAAVSRAPVGPPCGPHM